jgi:hypothetical protein
MEMHAFGFRLWANGPEGQKRFAASGRRSRMAFIAWNGVFTPSRDAEILWKVWHHERHTAPSWPWACSGWFDLALVAREHCLVYGLFLSFAIVTAVFFGANEPPVVTRCVDGVRRRIFLRLEK